MDHLKVGDHRMDEEDGGHVQDKAAKRADEASNESEKNIEQGYQMVLLNALDKQKEKTEEMRRMLDEATAELQKDKELISELKETVKKHEAYKRSLLVPAVKLQAQKAKEIVQKCGSFRTTMQKLKEMPLIMVRMPITATTKTVEAFHHAYPGETDSLVDAMDNMASVTPNETLRSPKTLVSLSVQAMLLPVMASVAVANVALGISKGAVSKTMSTMSSVSLKALRSATNALSSMAGIQDFSQ